MKKKLIIIGPWPLPAGGVASHVQDLFNNLSALDSFDVIVYGIGKFCEKSSHIKQANLLRIPFINIIFLVFMFLRIPRGSIIHTHSFWTAYPKILLFKVFLKLLFIKKCIWIETLHDETLIQRFQNFSSCQKGIYRLVNKNISKLITISESLKNFCASQGISSDKIEVINSLLPIKIDFRSQNCTNNKFYKQFKKFLDSKSYLIVTSGAFIPLYDFETIVFTFIELNKEKPNGGLIILNTTFAIDRKYQKNIYNLIKTNPNSILIFNDVSREVAFEIYRKSNLFIRGAMHDSFGLSKVESLLNDTPVICTNSGETRFMDTYIYGNSRDLYNKICDNLFKNKFQNIDAAKMFYNQMARHNFSKIIKIYEERYSDYIN